MFICGFFFFIHMIVLWASFDLIAGEFSAEEQKCRTANLQVANCKEKA
jgi:hypothetical protein